MAAWAHAKIGFMRNSSTVGGSKNENWFNDTNSRKKNALAALSYSGVRCRTGVDEELTPDPLCELARLGIFGVSFLKMRLGTSR